MSRSIIKQAEQWPSRIAEWDENAAMAHLDEEDLKKWQGRANGLKYVTPQPGVTMAVGPNWSGFVPTGHPDYIPRQSIANDIYGYLHHDNDGYVHFIHTNPMMRRMGVGKKMLEHAGILDTVHAINLTPDGRKLVEGLGNHL